MTGWCVYVLVLVLVRSREDTIVEYLGTNESPMGGTREDESMSRFLGSKPLNHAQLVSRTIVASQPLASCQQCNARMQRSLHGVSFDAKLGVGR